MVDDRLEIKIKTINFENADAMTNPRVQNATAEDFEINNDFEFLQSFACAKTMPSGCLIIDDWRLVKVSEGTNKSIFQNYYKFLPEADEDQVLLIDQIKTGLKHNRICLVFNYPHQCRPKRCQVQPFFDDNKISLSYKEGQVCWIEQKDVTSSAESEPQTNPFFQNDLDLIDGKRVFQLVPSNWKLFEYDMAGLLTQVTSYAA